MIERQKLQHEHRGEPDYALVLSPAFDQQQTFLLQQARYVTDQIPDLVVSVEYTAMGYFYWLAGDLPAAEANYKKAVDRAPDTTYRLSAITAYSWFLFTQRRFEEAREQYRKGITERIQTDHFARYQKGRTYMFWGLNERNLAQASSLAEQAFESAAAEFRGIDLEALRENALKELNAIKSGQAAIPPMHSESTQAVPPIANT